MVQVEYWVVSAYTKKPPLPGFDGEPPGDLAMRRKVERWILDRTARRQLACWCRAQAGQGSFREDCRDWGWNRNTALAAVERSLETVYRMMNFADEGRY